MDLFYSGAFLFILCQSCQVLAMASSAVYTNYNENKIYSQMVIDDFPSAGSGFSWLELPSSADTKVAQQPDGLPCMQYTSCLPEPVDGCRAMAPVIVGGVLMNTSSSTAPYVVFSPNLKPKTKTIFI